MSHPALDNKLRGGIDYKTYKDKLNQLKSKASYHLKILKTLEPETERYKTVEAKIKKINYDRFILKLNESQIKTLKAFCEYHNISFDPDEERIKILT